VRTRQRNIQRSIATRGGFTALALDGMLGRMTVSPDVRWKQRFQNFDRAHTLLQQALANGPDALNPLEREGTVQRFEFCFELAWKSIKDYMEFNGTVFVTVAPRPVLKEAFAAKILQEGQVWIDMLDNRNLLSHTYSQTNFEKAMDAIHVRYLPALSALHAFLLTESVR
jgi:nucleotidyltransferase substrate binding protein (TIGR01987 family)